MPLDNRKKKKINVDDIIETQEVTPESSEPTTPIELEEPTMPAEPESSNDEQLSPQDPENTTEPIVESLEAAPEEKSEVSYKEKFSESSREAMSLHFKNEKLNALLSGELDVYDPTEDEIRSYAKENDADYDELDTFAKNMLKRTLISERKEAKRIQAYEEIRKIDSWAKKVEEFVSSEENVSKYPSPEGQEEDFKRYCMKETQRGVDFDLLVGSFLYKNDTVPEKKNKGSMFLSRGNGRAAPPKPVGITAGEAGIIRKNDPKEYRRLIKSGKIKIEV